MYVCLFSDTYLFLQKFTGDVKAVDTVEKRTFKYYLISRVNLLVDLKGSEFITYGHGLGAKIKTY